MGNHSIKLSKAPVLRDSKDRKNCFAPNSSKEIKTVFTKMTLDEHSKTRIPSYKLLIP